MKTEQEQIEEITSIINSDICDKDCPNRCPYCGALSSREAKKIYNAGYHKADGVRKDTAKEILDMLYDMGIDKETLECCRIFDVNGVSLAKQICEKYGVEVQNEQKD